MLYSQVIRTAVFASLLSFVSLSSASAVESDPPGKDVSPILAAAYECDRLATRPHDISSPSKGVAFEDIDAEPAIRACREATRKFPTTGRFFTQLGRSLLKVKRLGQAGRALKKAEELSHPPALDIIGYMYENGFSVVRNAHQARKYYQRAAEPGDAYGQYNLGRAYLKGIGGEERREEGMALLKKAADKGVAEAMYLLGDTTRADNGGDLKEALVWYEKAAQSNHIGSQNLLGAVYGEGGKIASNPEEAFKWTEKAAERGNAEAQARLGVFYLRGTGTSKDEATAAEWLKKAADQDYGRAQAELGVLYAEGRGVKRDYYHALRLFRKGMDAKEPKAFYHMGLMYESGLGVVQSAERAQEYFKGAADLGHKLAAAKLEEAAKLVNVASYAGQPKDAEAGAPEAAEKTASAKPEPASESTDWDAIGGQLPRDKSAVMAAKRPEPKAAKVVKTKVTELPSVKKTARKSADQKPDQKKDTQPGVTRLSQLGLIGTLD